MATPSLLSLQVRRACSLVRIVVELNNLKGLGHAILGNFSTDQLVIELKKK